MDHVSITIRFLPVNDCHGGFVVQIDKHPWPRMLDRHRLYAVGAINSDIAYFLPLAVSTILSMQNLLWLCLPPLPTINNLLAGS